MQQTHKELKRKKKYNQEEIFRCKNKNCINWIQACLLTFNNKTTG